MEPKNIKMKIQFEDDAPKSKFGGKLSGEVKKEDLIEFGDILEAAAKTLRSRIQGESTLTIELAGQVGVEKSEVIDGGINQIIVFKVGGSQKSDRTTSMRVTLETKIKPEK